MYGWGAALSRILTALCKSSSEALMEEISASKGDEEQHEGVIPDEEGSGFVGAGDKEVVLRSSNSRIRCDNIE